MKKYLLFFASFIFLLTACSSGEKENTAKAKETLILATTTSTQDSGLLDELLPLFEKQANIEVKTIAVGSGQALEMAAQGEADVLLVHAPSAEEELVATEDVTNRKRVMYNDFILVGPSDDPAKVKSSTITEAFQTLSSGKGIFVSRADDSGTHKKELSLWQSVGVQPSSSNTYLETGQGMGATLQVAAEKNGYTLTDRATFLAQEKNLSNLTILVEGDPDLLNIYHVMQVNEEKHDKVHADAAKAFVDFMVDAKTQQVIEDFGKKEYGQSLFHSYLD